MRGEWQFAPPPFLLDMVSKIAYRQNSGSFATFVHIENLEIHKVFLRLSMLHLRQNLSLSALQSIFSTMSGVALVLDSVLSLVFGRGLYL